MTERLKASMLVQLKEYVMVFQMGEKRVVVMVSMKVSMKVKKFDQVLRVGIDSVPK